VPTLIVLLSIRLVEGWVDHAAVKPFAVERFVPEFTDILVVVCFDIRVDVIPDHFSSAACKTRRARASIEYATSNRILDDFSNYFCLKGPPPDCGWASVWLPATDRMNLKLILSTGCQRPILSEIILYFPMGTLDVFTDRRSVY